MQGSGGEEIEFRYFDSRGAHACSASTSSRASCRTSSGATTRPNRSPCARSSRATSARAAAPSATARASRSGAHSSSSAARRCPTISALPVRRALEFFNVLVLEGWRQKIAAKIVKEITDRLGFLVDVGLDYLTLDRSAETLSGGEAQRIRLASQIGSGLVGVMYILDEPSIGLHQRDNQRLLDTLHRLRDLGNTVIVVEHDEDAIRQADHVVDLGPGAGVHGGRVVAQGTPAQIEASPASLTGQYLSGTQAHRDPGRSAARASRSSS